MVEDSLASSGAPSSASGMHFLGTSNDQKDMDRVGKVQELSVSARTRLELW